jgi:hypothetical protein
VEELASVELRTYVSMDLATDSGVRETRRLCTVIHAENELANDDFAEQDLERAILNERSYNGKEMLSVALSISLRVRP